VADVHELSRLEKLRQIADLGIDPWGGRFDGHQPIGEIRAIPLPEPPGVPGAPPAEPPPPPPRVRAAGRIVQRRTMGKAHFLNLQDWTGRIQVYISMKDVGDQGWKVAQNLDLGDLLGVEGKFGKTRTGELTIFADSLTYLGKSLEPHPDNYYGMHDMEYRLRHRYLDLIYNPETLDRALKRVKIIRTIRRYLDERGYMEVETPVLHAIAGGAAARPFTTHHNALDIDLYLRIALELHLKRLLVGGIEKVYEIGRVFRNEGISHRHNPEFTMMELYQAYGDYGTMMDLTEGLIVACVEALGQGTKLPYGERQLDFTPPFERKSYADLFREGTGADLFDDTAVAAFAQSQGMTVAGVDPDVLRHKLFEAFAEPKLAGRDQPVFVYDYPAGLCPLTKRKRGDDRIAERFELYVHGMELANAYTELNDPDLQEKTFRTQLAGLAEEDSMAKMDDDFIRALRHGMPPAGGLGIGIDRMVMLLTNTETIRDVILFPLLRPEQ
jgi:lysyl-tRNA synthetase class 2